MPRWQNKVHRYLLPGATAAVIFCLDAISNVDVVSILYVNVILLSMRSRRREDIVIAGCGTIGLTVLSFLLTLDVNRPLATILINNGLSVLAIACVMILCLKNFDSQTEIIRTRDRVALISRSTTLQTVSAAIVHEITQPLTAIGASAQAAHRWLHQSPPNCEETKTASQRIVAEADRASNVVKRLERLTMPDRLAAEDFDVQSLLESVVDRLRIEIDDAGVDVAIECPSDLEVSADRVMIEQVVINAFANAIDALRAVPVGRRRIDIEAKPSPGFVTIAVRDNGKGADAATLEHMFDPFFTTKGGSGMGIGLAVSKSIVEAHGGTIRAVSNARGGLSIEFELPRRQPDSSLPCPRDERFEA